MLRRGSAGLGRRRRSEEEPDLDSVAAAREDAVEGLGDVAVHPDVKGIEEEVEMGLTLRVLVAEDGVRAGTEVR